MELDRPYPVVVPGLVRKRELAVSSCLMLIQAPGRTHVTTVGASEILKI